MDAVVPEVQKKRPIAIGGDEFFSFVGQAIDDVLAFGAVGDGADADLAAGLAIGLYAVGRKIEAGRTRIGMAVEGDVEALFFWPIGLREAEVPFADVGRFVAGVVQGFGEGVLARLQIVFAFGR
jgi:hypothetical protein